MSIIAVLVFLRFWKPKKIWRFDYDETAAALPLPVAEITDQVGGEWGPGKFDGFVRMHTYTARQILKAWMPFAVLSLFALLWGLPRVKLAMNQATTPAFQILLSDGKVRPGPPGWDVPYLHNAISRAVPIVAKPTPERCSIRFQLALSHRNRLFLCCNRLWATPRPKSTAIDEDLLENACANASGDDCDLFYAGAGLRDTLLGSGRSVGVGIHAHGMAVSVLRHVPWLAGVALTGSDTSANALFGSLQRITSQQLGIDPILMCAANSAGGVMGKMVDAQSITIATAATEQVGNEGIIFRFVAWHSVALCAIVGVIVLLYAYVFRSAVPHGMLFVQIRAVPSSAIPADVVLSNIWPGRFPVIGNPYLIWLRLSCSSSGSNT